MSQFAPKMNEKCCISALKRSQYQGSLLTAEMSKYFQALLLGQVRHLTAATAAITLACLFVEMLCYVLGRNQEIFQFYFGANEDFIQSISDFTNLQAVIERSLLHGNKKKETYTEREVW